jgi:hypothetical protein
MIITLTQKRVYQIDIERNETKWTKSEDRLAPQERKTSAIIDVCVKKQKNKEEKQRKMAPGELLLLQAHHHFFLHRERTLGGVALLVVFAATTTFLFNGRTRLVDSVSLLQLFTSTNGGQQVTTATGRRR